MPVFRPFPILTLCTLAGLALLLWLGHWQTERRAWKIDLLAQFAQSANASPVSLSDGLCAGRAAAGQAVTPASLDVFGPVVRVYGRDEYGAPGWRLFERIAVPACLQEGGSVLVETGFEGLQTATRSDDSEVREAAERSQLRFEQPTQAGALTPVSDVASNSFYAFDPEGMAARLEVEASTLNAQWWLVRSDGTPPAYLTQTPPERHLAYAITWYVMSLALLVVYFAFHISAGRLRWSQR